MPEARQGYKLGWVGACSAFAVAVPDIATLGPFLGLTIAGWSLAVGLAATLVRPWAWYVLILYCPMGIIFAILYNAHFAKIPSKGELIVYLVFVLVAALVSGYFYKRRAMFDAKWHWRVLERAVPRLVGPETYEGPLPGFFGLSYRKRLLFLFIVIVMIGIRLLELWVSRVAIVGIVG